MTINNAKTILNFILKHFNAKVSKEKYEDCVWKIANLFNVEEE